MKQFKVFKHPLGETQAVKQGWCWPAFFFGPLWALVAKIWGIALTFLAISFILGTMEGISGTDSTAIEAIVNIASFIIALVFGFYGNPWREKNLLSRGFEFKDTVTAANKDGAVALYIKNATV